MFSASRSFRVSSAWNRYNRIRKYHENYDHHEENRHNQRHPRPIPRAYQPRSGAYCQFRRLTRIAHNAASSPTPCFGLFKPNFPPEPPPGRLYSRVVSLRLYGESLFAGSGTKSSKRPCRYSCALPYKYAPHRPVRERSSCPRGGGPSHPRSPSAVSPSNLRSFRPRATCGQGSRRTRTCWRSSAGADEKKAYRGQQAIDGKVRTVSTSSPLKHQTCQDVPWNAAPGSSSSSEFRRADR